MTERDTPVALPPPRKLLAEGVTDMVRTGDLITLDAADAGLEARRAVWSPPAPVATRDWCRLCIDDVNQTDPGADLHFLVGPSGSTVSRESR